MKKQFNFNNKEDGDYYERMIKEIVKEKGFNYLTTNKNLHEARSFVQQNKKVKISRSENNITLESNDKQN